jgi:hypothetical protein
MVRAKINKRKLLTTLSPLLILLAIAGFAFFIWTFNVVLVRNSSGMTLDEFTLTVCKKDYTLANILDGETGKLHFTVTGDSSFQMRAKLQDGTVLSNSFGYVTGGAGAYHNRVTITIRSNLIEGTQQ